MAKIDKRIDFLAEKYNVFMDDEYEGIITDLAKTEELVTEVGGTVVDEMLGIEEKVMPIAILHTKITKEVFDTYNKVDSTRTVSDVKVHESVFADMLAADPTPNKVCLQWMLTVFTRFIKDGNIDHALRFAKEDLPMANEYLVLFEGNKRKQMFKRLCEGNFALKHIGDPTNINQYKDLSQLFDAVDPFIEREPSTLEKAMQRFVDAGEAEIPMRDRRVTLYIPTSKAAAGVVSEFTSWCTATSSYTNYDSYTNQQTPLGTKSKLYIIIRNEFFDWDMSNGQPIPNNMMYQLHVESGQLMERNNSRANDFYDEVIEDSDGLAKFFYEEFKPMAKAYKGSIKDNRYVNRLIEFGFADILFDMLDDDQPIIKFTERAIPKLPNISRFRNVDFIYLGNTKTKELDPSIGNLPLLEILSVPNNKLTTLPKELAKCKKLTFINLCGNKLQELPDELALLDETRGGSLHRISVRKADIGEKLYNRLKELLPTVLITEKSE